MVMTDRLRIDIDDLGGRAFFFDSRFDGNLGLVRRVGYDTVNSAALVAVDKQKHPHIFDRERVDTTGITMRTFGCC